MLLIVNSKSRLSSIWRLPLKVSRFDPGFLRNAAISSGCVVAGNAKSVVDMFTLSTALVTVSSEHTGK